MQRFLLYSAFIILLTACNDLISNHPDLGKGYRFVHEGKYGLSIVNSKNTQVIGQTVLEYKFDSTFILVSQRPDNSILGSDTMTYSEYNNAFEKSTFKQYWIIDKSKSCENIGFDSINQVAKYSNVFGPYTKSQFVIKMNVLGIPEYLLVEDE
jgi:hypothetical protein